MTQAKKLVKAPASKQVYTVPQVGITDIATLDPALVLAADQPSMSAIQMIYTGLVQLDDKLQVQPQLAASWDVSSDGLSWTFHLRHNLKFSDGTPLTSADVAYSIDRALQPSTKSPVAPIYLSLIRDSDKLLGGFTPTLINDSLLTPDANTLIITLKKKAPYFLAMLTYPCSFVVEKHLIDTYKTAFTDHLTEGGSTGPFKVSLYTHGKEIEFRTQHRLLRITAAACIKLSFLSISKPIMPTMITSSGRWIPRASRSLRLPLIRNAQTFTRYPSYG